MADVGALGLTPSRSGINAWVRSKIYVIFHAEHAHTPVLLSSCPRLVGIRAYGALEVPPSATRNIAESGVRRVTHAGLAAGVSF